MSSEKRLLLGNEAIARGAWEAGVCVVSSYPGTPSTEITENIAKYDEIYSEWAPNEKVAAEVAIGAAVAGRRAMCCMKHVGLNVAADPFFTASYTGVNAGLVFVVADDPGMHSSQNEQDSRFYGLSAHIPVLEPSDSSECHSFIKLAFEISETFDTPVLLRITTRIAHQRSLVEVSDRVELPKKEYKKDPMKYVMMPAMAKGRHLFVEERMGKIKDVSNGTSDVMPSKINFAEYADGKDGKLGIITSGISYQYAREVFPNASFLKLGLVHPLPAELIKSFAEKVDELLIIEELEPFIENFVKQNGIHNVKGKELFSIFGELGTAAIRKAYYGDALSQEKLTEDVSVPPRPPVLCAGCPHRGIFYNLSKMKVRVSGDIGCYTLGALAPYTALDTCVCMGASISMAHGMEKADLIDKDAEKVPTVAIIGDSTFMHSGITSLIDVVYNKGASTVIILDNSITGMTGHQQNPTTGLTIKGEEAPAVNLLKLCEAIGIKRVRVEDPFDLKGMQAAIKEELAADEPSVIISQRPCALLKKVNYGAPVAINSDKCKKCGKCMTLGCPAIIKKDGAYEIDATQCVGCQLCEQMCAFGAISK
ncbi:MAG: indolepyruvate ferredoxin oxidoreductase subunit alpha [Ruminococcaceae bacterium]|nr:indolepyruvate ferredoxin oxidoreductase subunit alpha [Oscillospiraceae bacterium]